MRRVLVTGAAGFVGSHLVPALCARLPQTDVVAGLSRVAGAASPPGIECHRLDLLQRDDLCAFVARFQPSDIVHLAASSSVKQSASEAVETWGSNVVALLNLVEATLKGAPEANLFFVSSGEVYGRAFIDGNAVVETDVPAPDGSYALSKWHGERMLLDILLPTKVRLVILRPFNHTGVGQDERFVVSSFASQIARIEAGLSPPRLEVGNLKAKRDFLDVADVARAYVDVILAADTLESGTIFNISSGVPRTIEAILNDLRAMARRPFEVVETPDRMRQSEIPIAFGDSSKLRGAVGWKPAIDWSETLAGILSDARNRCRMAPPGAS